MPYSKVTSKGQLTVPVAVRRKHHLEPGTRVSFEEKNGDLILRPLPDIADSAGSLSKHGKAEDLIQELLAERRRPFR